MFSSYQVSKVLVDERQARLAHEVDENRLARAFRSARRSHNPDRRSR